MYSNITFAGGRAWYVERRDLHLYWQAHAEMVTAGHPVFVNETHSVRSPDTRTSFFLDFDSREDLPDSLVHLFVWDVVALIRRLFASVNQEIPVAEHCLLFAIKDSGRNGFGCHVVLNSVLVDTPQARAMARVAHHLWAETGWSAYIDLDEFATSGLRPILSNKIRFFPLLDNHPVPVNVGRMYDIVCTFHYRGDLFSQASTLDDEILYKRPWDQLPSTPDFAIESSELMGRCVVYKYVLKLLGLGLGG